MPYIGRGPAKSGAFRILDDVSGSFNGSTTSFALTVGSAALTVGLPETLLIAVDGVVQEAGSAYTISGSNIVFTAAPQADATFWGVELGDVGGLAERATTQSASNDSTKIATTAYVDNQIDVQLTAEDLDVTGDSGTIAIDLDSEALAITGGTGITTTASGNAVNIVGHAEAHTVASHSDTTGTGAEVETLTDGSNAESLHTHTHTVVSHSDTTITGAELTQLSGISANVTDTNLNALTDSSTTTALHLHAAGSTAEHGASAHTNLTRYIWMPPGPVHTNCVFEPNRIPLIKLPVNVTATVNFGFQVPVDYHSHTASNVIRLVWFTNVSGGNNMYGRFTSYGQGAGESIEGTSEVTSEETMTANGNKLITVSNKSDYLDLSGIAVGDFLGVDFRRNGSHSSDTISDDVRVLGMLFTYTATQ